MTHMRYKENGISLSLLKKILFVISIVFLLSFVKIYISSQIYYTSKIVNDMQQDVTVLRAEKKMLEHNIEALRFKTEVVDVEIKSSLEPPLKVKAD
ncbi:MAG: hypothetical protein JXQ77_02695 [Campylobacterales bacterium]|nr:hypothetical protein [Campylobacterales bacterium]